MEQFDGDFALSFDLPAPPEAAAARGQEMREALLADLNEPQREGVVHGEGPLLILAGAGSGKTRVITRRIAYLIRERGVSPYEILAITFTNKAAGEMKQRVAELVGEIAERMWIGTFHSMFARILRRHAEILGYTSSYTIADTADSQQMIRQLVRELELDEKRYDARMVLNQISAAKNALLGPEKYREKAGERPIYKQIARIYQLYQERMRQSNCMDFDDILVNTVRLFARDKEVLAIYQQRFRYIMVDEYQDTNGAQYEIVKALAAAHKNLCVVGDDDQSIYSFRGADIRNILNFEKDYRHCKIIKLEQNYRSTETILGAANALIANNRGRKKKTLWTGARAGEAITFLRANDHFDEARYLAREIISRRKAQRSLKYADFAVLYRAGALSRNLEMALREEGVPYRIYGGLRFYDRKEIKDVLAYLRLIASDRDELAFLRAVNTPRRGIGEGTLTALRAVTAQTGEPMLRLCAEARRHPELGRAAAKLEGFAALIFELRRDLRREDISFQDYVELVQEKSGLLSDILENRALGKDNAAERIENLKELLSDAYEFSRQMPGADAAEAEAGAGEGSEASAEGGAAGPPALSISLQAFLERAALYSEQDMEEGEEDFVRLMTIHAAKGLEFKYVFLLCAENGIFPSARSMEEEKGVEEERRLAYVAITRAMEKLYITTARSRTLYGQTLMNPVSLFVREIPEQFLEEIGGSSRGEQAAYGAGTYAARGYGMRSGNGGAARGAQGRTGAFGRREDYARAAAAPDYGHAFGAAARGARDSALDARGLDFVKGRRPRGGSSAAGGEAEGAAQLSAQELRSGLRVRSARFGEGVILSYEPVAGDAIVEVRFAGGRPKRMMLNSAKLTRLED